MMFNGHNLFIILTNILGFISFLKQVDIISISVIKWSQMKLTIITTFKKPKILVHKLHRMYENWRATLQQSYYYLGKIFYIIYHMVKNRVKKLEN